MLSRCRLAFSQLFRFATNKPATTAVAPLIKYGEKISKARAIFQLYDLSFYQEDNNYVAPNATIVGEVTFGTEIAIWGGTVIRGDINEIRYAAD